MSEGSRKIRVVVVDDSALVRSLIKAMIDAQPDMTCIGAATDPYMAREMIRELDPDVITLDVEMPRMDGLDFLEKLMRLRPMPVVMVSTLTERGAETGRGTGPAGDGHRDHRQGACGGQGADCAPSGGAGSAAVQCAQGGGCGRGWGVRR